VSTETGLLAFSTPVSFSNSLNRLRPWTGFGPTFDQSHDWHKFYEHDSHAHPQLNTAAVGSIHYFKRCGDAVAGQTLELSQQHHYLSALGVASRHQKWHPPTNTPFGAAVTRHASHTRHSNSSPQETPPAAARPVQYFGSIDTLHSIGAISPFKEPNHARH
jgi:hypothetical protein